MTRARIRARSFGRVETRRVTLIGWIGLGLSVLAVALLIATIWLYDQDSACGEGHHMSNLAFLAPWSLLATLGDFIAAIVVDTIAVGRGAGNRIVGIIGRGIMAASPVVVIVLAMTFVIFF
jgi:hypothetical protein